MSQKQSRKKRKAERAAVQNQQPKLSPGQALMKAAKTVSVDKTLYERESISNFEKAGSAAKPEPELALQSTQELPNLVAPETTEEQRLMLAAGQRVNQLLAKQPYSGIYAAMVSARQLNTVAYRELENALEKETDLPQLTKDVFVGAAAFQASKHFSAHDFINTHINSVLPWLAELVDTHTQSDADAAREAYIKRDTERRALSIPLGFKYDQNMETTALARGYSLTLVGWSGAVNWLLSKIIAHVLADEHNLSVVRLQGKTATPSHPTNRLAVLRAENWTGCCNSKKTLAHCMGQHLLPQMSSTLPDLVICDALGMAHTTSYTGRDVGAVAGDAHRVLSSWCVGVGAALIGCAPWPDKQHVDTTGPAYQQLRIHSGMCVLSTLSEAEGLAPAHYRIIVNQHAAVFDVPCADVDACAARLVLAG